MSGGKGSRGDAGMVPAATLVISHKVKYANRNGG